MSEIQIETIIKVIQLKNQQYQLVFDSGRKLIVFESVLIKEQLLKGTQMTANFIQKVEQEMQLERNYQLALNYLSYQMRTMKEVQQYLTQREVPVEMQRVIMQKLQAQHFVDDLNYAKQYVAMQKRTQDQGPMQIKNKLLQKGVDLNFIEEALQDFDDESLYHNALAVARKTQKKYHNKTIKEAKNKITQRLLTKGYPLSLAKQVVDELEFTIDLETEWEMLVKYGDKLWKKYSKYDDYKRQEKVKQSLYQKGYSYDLIVEFIDLKNDL